MKRFCLSAILVGSLWLLMPAQAFASCTASEVLALQRQGFPPHEIEAACGMGGAAAPAPGSTLSPVSDFDGIWQVAFRPVSCRAIPSYEHEEDHCPVAGTRSWNELYAPHFWRVSVSGDDIFAVVAPRARRACRAGTQFLEYDGLRIRRSGRIQFEARKRNGSHRSDQEFKLEANADFTVLSGEVETTEIIRDPETREFYRIERVDEVIFSRWPGTC